MRSKISQRTPGAEPSTRGNARLGRAASRLSTLLGALAALTLMLPVSGWTGVPGNGLGAASVGAPAALQATFAPSATPLPALPTATPTLTPYTGDPVAARSAPVLSDPVSRFFTETGHLVSGDFWRYYARATTSPALLGLPLTEEFAEQLADGGVYRVQYFERARLEFHPEAAQAGRVQLGALGKVALGDRTQERIPAVQNTISHAYFAETGHTLANGFLNYWLTNGGLAQFGYPLSEEMGEDGVAVQYFERARFEYHRNLEGTPYAVQLSPVGYLALKGGRYNVPMGTMVRFLPPRLAEGHTATVEVAAGAGITVTGEYEGRPLLFTHDTARGVAWALIGAVPFRDLGWRTLTVRLQNGDGGTRTVARNLEIVAYPFPSESLQFDPETAALLDPTTAQNEANLLAGVFSARTPVQYWHDTFRMPLDSVRITSQFATRRCYNCPAGSKPTSYHGGLDMGTPEGTQVHAPAAGVVVFAGRLDERGNAIIIDHGLGVFSLFAHNSKLLATVGQAVQKGDVVSLSGNTGLSNGPHLHWEVHVSGPGVDPLEWVRRAIP